MLKSATLESVEMKECGRILVLIDNAAALAQVEPHFAALPEAWKVHVSQSSEDALCQLEQVAFDVIFVDLKSGPLASIQFLHQVWSRHPSTIRFLLSDSLAPDIMVTCALGPHQVLLKPLEGPAIRNAMERAALVNRLFQNKDVQTLVSRIRTFPSRPTIYAEVIRELRSSNASAQTVGELVSRDLAISAKLLQITNSAFFGFNRPVAKPGDAVLLLGMETTASLVLGIEAFSQLDNVKLKYFSTDQIWRHCQIVANSARAIAEHVTQDADLAQEAYTAALLHDIGKLALAVNLDEAYRDALNVGREKHIPAWQVERQAFGATHAEAGAYLLSLWGLPANVIEAVANHHIPARELSSEYTALTALHVANAIDHSLTQQRVPGEEVQIDLDYPAELRIIEQLDTFRDIVQNNSRAKTGATQFIRKMAVPEAPALAMNPQTASDTAPNGFWSRFRGLLAT
ncbi:MAG: HDOD domain-containing protein [Limisphaerales bacterium]